MTDSTCTTENRSHPGTEIDSSNRMESSASFSTIANLIAQAQIHPTAIIDPTAKIAPGVQIGPWTLIGPEVEIGEGSVISSHVVIKGPTRIGKNNNVFQFCSIGEIPQDKKYKGERTYLEIGDGNTFREYCTINRGTAQDKSVTRIGNDNLFMAYVHIAHDCIVGNNTIFGNAATLAGHVIIEDFAILSGFSGLSQKCRMGKHSFACMGAVMDKDVPPFVKVSGYYAKPFGLNSIGMKRCGFSDDTVLKLRRAYKIIYRKGLVIKNALEELQLMLDDCPEIKMFIDFIQQSERGIIR